MNFKQKRKSIIMCLLFIIFTCVFAQTERWIYYPPDKYISAHYGSARSVTYGSDGNIYAVGGVPGAGEGITFEKIYGEPARDEAGWGFDQTLDSSYIILADGGSPTTIFLLKTNIYGDTSWTTILGEGYGRFVRQTIDGGYIITGKQNGQMFLAKTDSTGNILWTKYYDAQFGYCVQQTLDRGYIVTGINTPGASLTLIKTDSLGDSLWSKTYSAPIQSKGWFVEQTTDFGYIVTGLYNDGNFYAWLLKIDSLGDTLWTKKYSDGWTQGYVTQQTYDGGYIIGATLSSAQVWIIKTDSNGDTLWTKKFPDIMNGYRCDIEQTINGGYIITATTTSADVRLWLIDSSGNELWSNIYGGAGTDFSQRVLQTNDKGYVVLGTSNSFDSGNYDVYLIKTDSLGTPISEDFTVVSFAPSGETKFFYQYNGPGRDVDIGFSVVRGLDNNIYAAGYTMDTNSFLYLTVVSVDSSGNERWVYQDTTLPTVLPLTSERAVALYGLDGNIYVMGNRLIVGLTSSGDTNWVYNPTNMRFNSLTYDSDGNLYTAGYNFIGGDCNFIIATLAPSGIERWVYQYNSSGDRDIGKSIVLGADGNVYAAGYTGSSGLLDYAVISIDTTGTERWVYTKDAGTDDAAYSIVYGSDSNIYAAGCLGSPYAMDWVDASLTSSGAENWIYSYNGPANVDDWANSVAYGVDGNIYTTGWSESTPNNPDFTIISTSPSGAENWVYRDSPGYGWSIVYGMDNNIYAAGTNQTHGFTVISLAPPQGIEQARGQKPESRYKLEVYPNPSSNRINIGYTIQDSRYRIEEFSLKVYDVSGRLIKTFSLPTAYSPLPTVVSWDGTDQAGQKLPAGVYFVQLEIGDCRRTKKVILLK